MTRDGDNSGLRRDGHVSNVGIDRYLYDDLDAAERAVVDGHLADCPVCAERVEEARAADAAAVLPPMPQWNPRPSPGAAISAPASAPASDDGAKVISLWRRAAPAAGVVLAAAAALVLVLWSPEPPPRGGSDAPGHELTVRKGDEFTLHMYVDDGGGGRLLTSGDSVLAGDRIGFRIHPQRAGYLMIVGIDGSNEPYLCFPQDSQDAALVAAASEMVTLREAVELDDVPGTERIVGVLCGEPFDFDTLGAALRKTGTDATPMPSCSVEQVVLQKSVVDR